MQFGIVGLGRMGGNLARHAVEKGHEVVGYDPDANVRSAIERDGVKAAASLADLVAALDQARIVAIYVPHGDPTEQVCQELRPLLAQADVVFDGGNSRWDDSTRRYHFFAESGVRFLDVGTSGGVSGARDGACFMVGGDREAYEFVASLLVDLAVDEQAVYYVGAPGSGHFAKLIHNAIEFGMVQAIGEGVELLKRSGFQLDLPSLFNNWMHGSVIRSWLVELMGKALTEYPDFSGLSTYVEDTSEVKWVLNWAMDEDLPTPVISAAQLALMLDRDLHEPSAIAVALLRNQYGGHPIHRITEAQRQ